MSDNESIVSFSEDISTAEAPPALPASEYPGQITQVTKKTSQRGTEYAEVLFSISPDDFPADYDASNAPDGLVVPYRRASLEDTPNARFRLRRFCEAIGAPMSKEMDLNDWVGLTAKLTLEASEWEGVPRNEITKVAPAD